MNDLEKYMISPSASVRDAIDKINSTGKKAIFITDENQKLQGIFTDGDMRKFILRNGDINAPITEAMNHAPVVFHGSDLQAMKKDILERRLIVYPVVNKEGQLIQAVFWNEIEEESAHSTVQAIPPETSTVIMAGGLGTRLYPYTKVLPKALIPIGDFPICTHIMQSFRKYGCSNFHLILNHKKNMIKAYYSDEKHDYSITYHDEAQFLGTAGGLYLLKGKLNDTCFVTNCDILVDVDYECVYKFHKQEHSLITIIGALRDVQIPYGVIKLDGDSYLQDIEEKPKFSFLTNVGVYVLEPEVIDTLNDGEFIHMPDLIRRYLKLGKKVSVFPVSGEQWLDMGQLEEMKQMTAALEEKTRPVVQNSKPA